MGLATVTEKKTGAWAVTLDPPLPYDKRTRGVAHDKVWFVAVKIQDQDQQAYAREAFLVVSGGAGDYSWPRMTYIHRIVKGKNREFTVKDAIHQMGYRLVDAVADKKKALIEAAKRKLTKDERKALGL